MMTLVISTIRAFYSFVCGKPDNLVSASTTKNGKKGVRQNGFTTKVASPKVAEMVFCSAGVPLHKAKCLKHHGQDNRQGPEEHENSHCIQARGEKKFAWSVRRVQTPTVTPILCNVVDVKQRMSTPQQSQGFAYPITGNPPVETHVTNAATPAQLNNQSAASVFTQTQTRQVSEDARKDRTLAEFMLMLDDYEPLVCELLVKYTCERATHIFGIYRYQMKSLITTCNALGLNVRT